MILWRRRGNTHDRARAAEAALSVEDKGAKLNWCQTDDQRYRLCVLWAEQARDGYYQGLRESVADMMLSNDLRYKYVSIEVRRSIGERKWSISFKAQELIGLEQMYSRWASQYKAGPESRAA